jgi:hypothetical protein
MYIAGTSVMYVYIYAGNAGNAGNVGTRGRRGPPATPAAGIYAYIYIYI